MENKKRVAVIAAHPDDEILGCGGSMSRFAAEGMEVFIFILGQGVGARHAVGSTIARELTVLRKCGRQAASHLKAKAIEFLNFPDNRFDAVPMLDIIKAVESFLEKVRPEIVFTHSDCDLNIDHQILAKAVMTATRPLPGLFVREVYSFEVLSSSEWNYGKLFSPNVFIDISGHLDAKKKAMAEYVSEIREYPHPRSLKGIEAVAFFRGCQAGFFYAEAFSLVRLIK